MLNRTHQILIRLFFVLILITGVSAVFYFWPTKNSGLDSRLRGNDNETTSEDSSSLVYDSLARNDNENGAPTTSGQRFLVAPSGLARNDSVTTSVGQGGNLDSRFRGNDPTPDPSGRYGASSTVQQARRYDITIIAGDRTYPLSVLPSTTVYDAMQLLQIDSRQPFLFSAKNYPGMGYFVEEINGVKNNPQANTYWIMYINGQSAPVGASQYVLKEGDKIEWKFEKAKF